LWDWIIAVCVVLQLDGSYRARHGISPAQSSELAAKPSLEIRIDIFEPQSQKNASDKAQSNIETGAIIDHVVLGKRVDLRVGTESEVKAWTNLHNCRFATEPSTSIKLRTFQKPNGRRLDETMVSTALLMSASYTAATKRSRGAELLVGKDGWQAFEAFTAEEHHLVAQAQPVSRGQEEGIPEIPDGRCHYATDLETPSEESEDADAGFH
jgi:hypothetical protein